MTTTKNNQVLLFEGAGMSNTGGNDVTNCRLRTRIKNNADRVIYLEITGHPRSKYSPAYAGNYEVCGHVSHCFYDDREEDARKNYSKDLCYVEHLNYEYSQKEILPLVNKHLDCSFTAMRIEEEGVRVHDTAEPLCVSTAVKIT